jgi:hypothetical protein
MVNITTNAVIQGGYLFNNYGAGNNKLQNVVADRISNSDASHNSRQDFTDTNVANGFKFYQAYFNTPPSPPMPPPSPPQPNVTALQATITTLQAAATAAAATVTTLQTAATADSATITTLQTTVATLQTAALAAAATISTLQTTASADAATIAALQTAATAAAAAITTLQTAATADASTITTLQTAVTTLQTAVTTLQAAASADAATIATLQTAATADAAAAIITLQTVATANASTITALQTAVTTLQTAATADAATIATLQATVLSGGGGGSSGGSGSALSPFSGVQCSSAACGIAKAVVNAFIGDSNVPITQAAAQSVADALSVIVADEVAPSAAQLTGIASALDTLAVAMLNNISAVGTASVTSPLLNMTVGLISPVTASGAAIAAITGATFDPLPVSTFAGLVAPGELVRLQYTSLGFDPYNGVTNGSSAVVSLAFTREDGAPLSVANLSAPITFTMPAPAGTVADAAVACRWWNAREDAYSSVGTFALPSPRPAGHNFSWAPGASVESGDFLAEAWRIDGPLAAGCTEMVLDCRSGQNFYESIALDPFNVAGAPLIVCGAVRQRLRVFYGGQCAMWQPDNSFACHWDATSQTFNGTGCVPAAATQCATLHLTSFISTTAPRIAVASASDLTDINPADLTTKLRMLFGVVIGLFGLMHVGALVGRVQDGVEQSASLAHLRSRSLGFTAQKGGAWTWRCTQDAVSAHGHGTRGSLVELARLIGMPYIRLRAALPEALLPGSVAAATGCAAGLSASYVSTGELSKAVRLASQQDVESAIVAHNDDSNETIMLTSTALVYALMSTRCIAAESELERQLQLSAAHFAALGADDDDGSRLRQLKTYFAAMLVSDNLRKRKDWLNRARLWRLILLSSDSGAYDPAQPGLAFALQAVSQRPDAVSGAKAAVSRIWALLGTAVALESGLSDDARPYSAGDAATYRAVTGGGHDTDAAFVDDCPISFSSDAILGCMPPALFAPELLVADAADGARLWTTALCCALMETLEVSWALNQPAFPGMPGVGDCATCETVLDRSSSFLAAQFASAAALGAVMAAARAQTAEWAVMQHQRISALCTAQLSTRQHVKLMGMRIMGDISKAGAVGHSTFGIFLAPHSDGIRRWQSFVVVISTLVALLTVNIWLTYSKALICCQDYRALLSCSADFSEPCRGSTADCVDLPSVFTGILDVGAPADWTCAAFPDATSSRDSFLVGLISFACSLPVTLLIANTFACANSADYTPAWLRWSARRTLTLGRQNWRYARPGGGSFLRVGFATSWGVNWYYNALQMLVVRPQAWLTAADQRRRERRGEARLQGAAAEARSKELQYAFFVALGIAATYVCWTIFAWVSISACHARSLVGAVVRTVVQRAQPSRHPASTCILTACFACLSQLIFAYGSLMYKLLGAAAQASFTKTWAIGVGISQATQFRDMIITAAQGLAVITVLDSLWLVGNGAWLEAHADLVCVDATLRDGEEERGGLGAWWPAQLRGYVQFFSAVQ